jgi:hypothetical protein
MRDSPDLHLVASLADWAHNLREPYSIDYRSTGSKQVTSSDDLTARYSSNVIGNRVRAGHVIINPDANSLVTRNTA